MKVNFSLSTKLFINNIFYAIPILVLLYLMFVSYDKDIIFAGKEVMGNDIQKPTMELIHQIAKNKKYTEDMSANMKTISGMMKKYESSLLLDDSSLHDRKRDHIQYAALTKTFEDFKAGKADAYKVFKDLRDLVVHTGDTSNLILDPDLDSYYLMDFTLIAAPQIADRFYEIEAFFGELAAKPNDAMTVEEKVKASVYLAMLRESDWGRIYGDIGTAVNEDKNFYGLNEKLQGQVKTKADALEAEFKNLFGMMEEIGKGNRAKAKDARDLTLKLEDESHAFYLMTIDTLTDLLNTRNVSILSARNKSTGIGVAAIIVALFITVLTSMNFNSGTKRISSALRQLAGAVSVNAEASEKLTESSSSLSAVSSQQAAAVQQTVSSLQEINAMSDRNFEAIKISSLKSEEGKEQAMSGKNSIYKMATTIQEIAESNQQFFDEINSSNEELRVIIKIISDITDRTKVINDIVFQTRLLSFNASVEAARAGEHGKGFAVVAEEIGKLAAVSGTSAKEINDILGQATNQVEGIISKMSSRVGALTTKAKAQLESGEAITQDCVASLNTIVENVTEMSMMMNEISLAITEQGKGYAEITKSIGQIDEGVNHGLGLSEETSSHAHKLNDQVAELKKIVHTIEIEVLGVASAA
jgi:methyl-accepting chemotaxis protein